VAGKIDSKAVVAAISRKAVLTTVQRNTYRIYEGENVIVTDEKVLLPLLQ
jgi:hypothetical protein